MVKTADCINTLACDGLTQMIIRTRTSLLFIGIVLGLILLSYIYIYPYIIISTASARLEKAIAQNDHAYLADTIRQLESARQWHAQDALLYRRLAQAYQFDGRLEDALTALEQAKALQPDSLLISIELATAYLRVNNIAMAAKALQDAGVLTSFLIEHANRLWQDKDYTGLTQYLQLIEINGEDTFSSRQFIAAQLARQQGDQVAEWALLSEAVTADRGWITTSMRSWAFVRYAEVCIRQKRFNEALAALETVLATTQGIFSLRDLGMVYRLRGVAFQGIGDTTQAEADLLQAVTLAPDLGWGWMSLGILRYTTHGEGWDEIDRALALEPTNRDLWNYLLAVLQTARDDQKVAWYCSQATQLQIPLNTVCR